MRLAVIVDADRFAAADVLAVLDLHDDDFAARSASRAR